MMTEMALKSAEQSVDAASIVFAHSVIDAAASDFLRVTSMASPADWEQFLDERKRWSVADVRNFGYERLFKGLLFEQLEVIERNWSLPTKLGRLQQLCRPQADWFLPIKYDEAALTRIDELRHDIIHGDSLSEPIPSVEADLQFLRGVGDYSFVLVHKRYGGRLVFYD